MISELKAREIARQWHNGQWSGLYKVSSCTDYARMSRTDWFDAYTEARKDAECASIAGAHRDYKALLGLADWIEYKARKMGHHVKGCLI